MGRVPELLASSIAISSVGGQAGGVGEREAESYAQASVSPWKQFCMSFEMLLLPSQPHNLVCQLSVRSAAA